MRYAEQCRVRTRHWRHLWESNVPDLDSLKELVRSRGCVAIDAEPWGPGDPTDITEIGIAYLPPIDKAALAQQPRSSLAALGQEHDIQSHCIRLNDRPRTKQRRERYQFGNMVFVPQEKVEDAILHILASFPNSPKPILVGFGLFYEMRLMSNQYPRLLAQSFSSWVDLQDLVTDISGVQFPSMRDTLIAFGFGDDDQAVRPIRVTHNAGNDAMRILAVLVSLSRLGPNERLTIEQTPPHKIRPWNSSRILPKERRLWDRRPRPREFYPFAARITLGKTHIMPTTSQLYTIFSSYSPTAAGVANSKHHGWVCLATHHEMSCFIQQVHGQEYEDDKIWSAIPDYDPSITPVETVQELKEKRREAQRMEKAAKRSELQSTEGWESLVTDFMQLVTSSGEPGQAPSV